MPITEASGRWVRRMLTTSRRWIVLATIAGAAVLAVVVAGAVRSDREPSRQEIVAERGALVMPFDLDATTHVFHPTGTGGVQTVVADDPTDDEQVELVRVHLRQEMARFRVGDFGDPQTIHGEEMPGVAVLEARFDALDMSYRDRPDGGQITYNSSDPAVVAALHDWFDAQVSDHGSHAESG